MLGITKSQVGVKRGQEMETIGKGEIRNELYRTNNPVLSTSSMGDPGALDIPIELGRNLLGKLGTLQ